MTRIFWIGIIIALLAIPLGIQYKYQPFLGIPIFLYPLIMGAIIALSDARREAVEQ